MYPTHSTNAKQNCPDRPTVTLVTLAFVHQACIAISQIHFEIIYSMFIIFHKYLGYAWIRSYCVRGVSLRRQPSLGNTVAIILHHHPIRWKALRKRSMHLLNFIAQRGDLMLEIKHHARDSKSKCHGQRCIFVSNAFVRSASPYHVALWVGICYAFSVEPAIGAESVGFRVHGGIVERVVKGRDDQAASGNCVVIRDWESLRRRIRHLTTEQASSQSAQRSTMSRNKPSRQEASVVSSP
jgi:hypothetical protein